MPKPQQEYVIKINDGTELYLLNPFSSDYEQNTWGDITNPNIMVRYTQAEVDTMAEVINSGTVGTTKPQ